MHVLIVLKDLKKAFPFIVVSDRVVSELNEDIDVWCCRCMNVVKSAFRHLTEELIHLRLHKFIFNRVEIMDGHIVHWRHQ